jgi:hypothetical protein
MAPSRPDCCSGSGLRIARQNHAKSADHPEFGFTRAPGPISTLATVTFPGSSVTDSAIKAKKIMKAIFSSPAFAVYELCSADKLRGRFACVRSGRHRDRGRRTDRRGRHRAAHEANLTVHAQASRRAGRDQRIGGLAEAASNPLREGPIGPCPTDVGHRPLSGRCSYVNRYAAARTGAEAVTAARFAGGVIEPPLLWLT